MNILDYWVEGTYIYVLQLEQDKWYVGQTSSLKHRMYQHFNGCGSVWTKLYKPLSIKELILLDNDVNASWMETNKTLQYFEKYGLNVRGAGWCSKELKVVPSIVKLLDINPDEIYTKVALSSALKIDVKTFNKMLIDKGFQTLSINASKTLAKGNSYDYYATELGRPYAILHATYSTVCAWRGSILFHVDF